MTTDGFANRLTALSNRIDHLERSGAASRSRPKLAKEFANDLGTVLHDLNQLMEASHEIGTGVDLCFTRLADWIERVKAGMATVPGNAQRPNSRIRLRMAEKTDRRELIELTDHEFSTDNS